MRTIKPDKDVVEIIKAVINQNEKILCMNEFLITHFSHPMLELILKNLKKHNWH